MPKKSNNLSSVTYRGFLVFQLILFKLMGLSPWTINISEILKRKDPSALQNNLIITSSLSGSAYNIFLTIFWIGYNIYLSSLATLTDRVLDLVTKSVAVNLVLFSIISPILMWLTFVLRRRKIIASMRQLMRIDEMLHRYHAFLSINNRAISVVLVTNFAFCICLLICLICTHQLAMVPVRTLPSLINSLILMQYLMILDAFYKRFKSINSIILKLSNVDMSIELHRLFVLKVPMRRHLGPDIQDLINSHARLCKMCEEISDFYGFPVLLTIIFFSTSSIFVLYFIFVFFKVPFDNYRMFIYLGDAAWFAIVIFGFLVVTTSVNRVVDESRKTGSIVHLLLNRCTMDSNLENQLIETSFGLLDRKVEFTACGIISLDGSLLQSVLGSIVTYLVILLQFHRDGGTNYDKKT